MGFHTFFRKKIWGFHTILAKKKLGILKKTYLCIQKYNHKKFSGRIGNRYMVYPKDLRKEQDLLCVPVFMTMFL